MCARSIDIQCKCRNKAFEDELEDIKSELEFTKTALGAASANIASSEMEAEHYTEENVHLEVTNTFLKRELSETTAELAVNQDIEYTELNTECNELSTECNELKARLDNQCTKCEDLEALNEDYERRLEMSHVIDLENQLYERESLISMLKAQNKSNDSAGQKRKRMCSF